MADGRIDSPLMTKPQWQQALQENGFSGIDILLDDHEDPVSMASVIIATAVEPTTPRLVTPMPIKSVVFVRSISSLPRFDMQQLLTSQRYILNS